MITSSHVIESQSYKQKLAGFFMRISNSIPINRPMDKRYVGTGEVTINQREVNGKGTLFKTEVREGYMIVINGVELKVKSIESDSKLFIEKEFNHPDFTWFTIYPKVDNSKFFETSISHLQNNFAISLFPEGETHEEPEMISVKGGIASMVLQCLNKGINPHIQCFSYFISSPTKFRNKTELILAPAFQFDTNVKDLSREQAYSLIVERITEELKNVMLPAKTFEQVELANFIGKVYGMKKFNTEKIRCLRNILKQVKEKGCEKELLEFMRIIKNKALELGVSKYSLHEVTETEFQYNFFLGVVLFFIVMII
jgi:1-acyl-sn-glycerol-3-phosphate acyltransferase